MIIVQSPTVLHSYFSVYGEIAEKEERAREVDRETTEQQKAVAAWLRDYAEHRQPFDEIKYRHTLIEVGDVAEVRYDWKIDREVRRNIPL